MGIQNQAIVPQQTRAVRRPLRRGQIVWCEACGRIIKGDFRIGKQGGNHYVICNVFDPPGSVNCNVEHFHLSCYSDSEPHGPIIEANSEKGRG